MQTAPKNQGRKIKRKHDAVIAIFSVLLPERSAVQIQNVTALHLRHPINCVIMASPEHIIATKLIQSYTISRQSAPSLLTVFRMTQNYFVEFYLIISYCNSYFKCFLNIYVFSLTIEMEIYTNL